jgi:hypothetical protein
MRKEACITLFLCLCCLVSISQTSKPIFIEGRNLQDKQFIFAAEIHSIEERWQFYESFCSYLVAHNGIRNIIIERGHAEAWLRNEYLRNGDTTYFKYFPKETEVRHFLDHLRLINDNLPDDKKLSIKGMDFDRMEFGIAVRHILEKSSKTNQTTFSNYIYSMPDSLLRKNYMTSYQHQLRKREYAIAQQAFTTSKDTLKQQLEPEDFTTLQLIFENPNTEKKWGYRDKGMFKNIVKQQLLEQPFLCIVGRHHMEYRRRDNRRRSLIKNILRYQKGIAKNIAIVDEVRNGPFREQHLFRAEQAQEQISYGTAGPRYFIKSDTAMVLAYSKYFKPQEQYTLVYKDLFNQFVKKDNHHLSSWYVFFGEPPLKPRHTSN